MGDRILRGGSERVRYLCRTAAGLLPGELNLGGDPRTVLSRSHSASLLSATEIAICGLLGVTANDFVQRKSGGADFLRLNKEHSDPNL
jgi:hypothetical protein